MASRDAAMPVLPQPARVASTPPAQASAAPGVAAWCTLLLTFALMLSDFMSRTIINAIFPILKAEWSLTDTQLGALVGIIPAMVGLMSLPVSVLADRFGRVPSVTAMALIWGLATLACGLAGNFVALLIARAVIGLGEAGYGSAGGAVLMQHWPSRRATVAGTFLSAALFGSVLGIAFGGIAATHFGWRAAFFATGTIGLVLAVLFALFVREPRAATTDSRAPATPMQWRAIAQDLFGKRSAVGSYLGWGMQSFVIVAYISWLPSYFNRYHAMSPEDAGIRSALLLLIAGAGTIVGGQLADRASRRCPRNRLRLPALYALAGGLLLSGGIALPVGPAQLALLGAGLFLASGTVGPISAAIADVATPARLATALAMIVVSGTLIGQAPGPVIAGILADAFDLRIALSMIPIACLPAASALLWAARHYDGDVARNTPRP